MAKADHQGGKKFATIKGQQESRLDEINQEYLTDDTFKDVEDLVGRLKEYKKKFMDFDEDNSGDIDFTELKHMLEKMGQAKTQMEAKKMLKEVAIENSETITYRDFLNMMLGKKNSVLRLILLFEQKMKAEEKPKSTPPKKNISQLP